MNKKLVKMEGTYWKIAKIVGVIFTLINHHLWINAGSIETAMRGLFLIVCAAVGVFVTINLIDLVLGLLKGVFRHIHRKIKDRRLLKGFCEQTEEN